MWVWVWVWVWVWATLPRRKSPRPKSRLTPGRHPATTRPLQALAPDVIHRAVVEAGRNISEAAKRLDVRRNTVDRKLRWNQTA